MPKEIGKAVSAIVLSVTGSPTAAKVAKFIAETASALLITHAVDSALFPRPRQVSDFSREITTEGGVKDHDLVYGTYLAAGHRVAEFGISETEYVGGTPTGDEPLEYYAGVIITGAGEIGGSVTGPLPAGGTGPMFRIDGRDFAVDPFTNTAAGDFSFSVLLEPFDGAPDQLDLPLLRGRVATRFRTTDRYRGLHGFGYVVRARASLFSRFPPNLARHMKGRRVYDPRKDDTQPGGSGAHRADDPGTWEWSANWALCVTDFVRSIYGPFQKHILALAPFFPGMLLPAELIDWETVIASANISDIQVDDGKGAGTTEAQFEINGAIDSGADPDQTFMTMLAAAGGRHFWRDGKLGIWPAAYMAPAVSMSAADIDPARQTIVRDRVALEQRITSMSGEIVSAHDGWRRTQYPTVRDADVTGGHDVADQGFPLVTSHGQAQRLAWLAIKRAKYARIMTTTLGPAGQGFTAGEAITMDYPSRGWHDLQAVCERRVLTYEGGLARAQVQLVHEPPDVFVPGPLSPPPTTSETEVPNVSGGGSTAPGGGGITPIVAV